MEVQYIIILRIFKFRVSTIYTFGTSESPRRPRNLKRIAGRGRPECRSRLSSTRPREFVPTLPVSTHRLCAMPTRSGRSYSIEAGSMNHVRESPEEHEIEEGEMERRPTKGFWEVILELLSIIPELVDVLRTRGLTCMQHCCAGSVTSGTLATVYCTRGSIILKVFERQRCLPQAQW